MEIALSDQGKYVTGNQSKAKRKENICIMQKRKHFKIFTLIETLYYEQHYISLSTRAKNTGKHQKY